VENGFKCFEKETRPRVALRGDKYWVFYNYIQSDVRHSCRSEALGSILWNRFGRNLRTNPNFLKFKFVIMTSHGFKMPPKIQRLLPIIHMVCTKIKLKMLLGGNLSEIRGWKIIWKVFGRNRVL
jgi:hypothetical protein